MTSANRARDLFFQKLRDREQQQPSTSQPGTTSTSRPTDESTQGTNSNSSALVGLLPMSFLRSPSLSPPVPEEQSRTLPFGQHGPHTRTVTASPPPAAVSFSKMVPMAAANCSISLLGNSSGNALAPETTTTSSLLANVLPSFHTLASSPRPHSQQQQQQPQQPYQTTTTTAAKFPMFPNGAYLGIGGSTATGSGSDVSSVQRTPPQLGRPHQREPAFQLFRSTTSGGGVGGTQRNSTSFHAGNASTLSPVVGGAGEGQVSGSASVGSFVAHVSFPSWHPGGSTTTALQLAPSDEGSISQLQQSRNAAAGGGPTHHLHHSQSRDVAARSALDVAGSSVSHNGNSIMMLPLPPPPSLQPNGDGGSSVLSVPLLTGNPSALPNHSSSTPTTGTNSTSNLTLGSCNLTSVVATSSSNAVALRRFTAKSFNSQRAGPLGTANSDMVATASSNDFAAMSTMFLQDAGLAARGTSDATPSDERTAGEAPTSSESRVRNPSTGTNTNSAGAAVSSAGLHRDNNSNAARYYGEEDEGEEEEGTDGDLLSVVAAGDGEVPTAMSSITHYEANFSAPRPGTSITTTATANGGGGSVSTTTLSVAGREVASCLPPSHQHNAQRRGGGDVTTVVELSRPIPRIPQQEHNQDAEEDHLLLQDREETTPSPQVPTTTSQPPPTFPDEEFGPQRPVIVEEKSEPNAMRDPPVCALVPQDNTSSSLWQQWGPTSSTATTIPAVQTVARCDISYVPATDLSSYARTDSSRSAGSHTKCARRTKSFVTEEDEGGPSSLAAPTSNDASLRQPHAPPPPPLPHDDDAPRRAIVHHSQPHDLHYWEEKMSTDAAAACLVPNQHSNEAMMMMMHRNPLPLPLPTLSSSLPRSQSRTTSSNTSQGGPPPFPPPAAPQPPSIPPSLGLASSFVRATPSASLLDVVLTHDESPFPLNVTSFQSSVLGRFNSALGGGAIHSPMSARTDPASRMSERSHTETFFSRSDLVTGMLRRPSSSRELSPTTTTTTTTTTTGAGTTHNGGIWRSSDETHLSVNSTSRLRAGSGMSTLPPTPVECGIAATSSGHLPPPPPQHHHAAHPPTKASPSLGPHHPSPRGMRVLAVDTAAAPTDAVTAQRDSSDAPHLAVTVSLPTRVGGHTLVGTAGTTTAAAEALHADDPLHLTHNKDGTTFSLPSPRVVSSSTTTTSVSVSGSSSSRRDTRVSTASSSSAGSVSSIKATQQQKEMMQMLRAMCGGDAGATVRPVQL